jgi:phospholipase/lecithinase/hemolysin
VAHRWISGSSALVLCLAGVLFTSTAAAQPFDRLVIFGDSLSDPGNHFVVFGETSHQPFAPIPDAPYAIGGHHFSNGRTWAERLAGDLNLPPSGKPALRVPSVFTNYAVGRARARAGAPVFPFYDLGTQVSLFLSDFGGSAPPDGAYAIWIGSNDLNDALSALFADPTGETSMEIIQAAVEAVAGSIQTLWASGARTFVILNVPNLAITPFVRSLGPEAQFAATQLSAAYNTALMGVLTALQPLPGIVFVRLDINALFDEIVATPEAVGLANVEDACLTFGVRGGALCSHPDSYLFWDGIHPTEAGHDIVATAARRVLVGP